ncbi:MAG TPA: hypothetical protein VF118_02700, partial [Gemmatimonadaceae bacterium]
LNQEAVAQVQAAEHVPQPRRPLASIASRVLLHAALLLVALLCLGAYQHFKLAGESTASWTSLGGAALFGFAPLRDVTHVLFGIEGRILHVVHGLGGLALGALPLTGVVSGTPVLTHAATAPFAIMGAAQALMHSNNPRNPEQAAALRRFVSSMPELELVGNPKNFSSPQGAQRAVSALADIIGKAQSLGETELAADPKFQSAWRQASTRLGANLGLDAVDEALGKLAANPATASAVPGLRAQLATARRTLAGSAPRSRR